MKKNIYNLLILILLSFILLFILIFSNEVLDCVLIAIKIWKENIFTSLFPFFIITDLLISYGMVDLLAEATKKIMNKLFYLPGDASFVIIASLFSGFPSSSKYIKELLDNNKINIEQAEYLLAFTHFPNPLFILGVVGNKILKNKSLGFIVLISIIIGNFIIAFSIRKKTKITINKTNIRNVLQNISNNNKDNKFIVILTNSIFKTIHTLTLLLGIITIFSVLNTIINNLLNTNFFSKTLISGILEMTQGVKKTEYLSIPLYLKPSLITAFISFGGISIHLQVISILSETNIKYRYYLICRIIHSAISSVISLILCKLIFNI